MKHIHLLILSLSLSPLLLSSSHAEATEPKSVCVLSTIGQTLGLKKVGIMVFGNEFDTMPIDDWKVDDRAYDTLKTKLSDRFIVKRITVPKDSFKPLDEASRVFRSYEDDRKVIVKKLVGQARCDYVLDLAAGGTQVSSTNQHVGGLGILELESVFGGSRLVHAIAYVRIYDAKTMDTLNRQRVREGYNPFVGVLQAPHQELEFDAHPSMKAAANDPATRILIIDLLEKALIADIPEFFAFLDNPVTASGTTEKWDPFSQQ